MNNIADMRDAGTGNPVGELIGTSTPPSGAAPRYSFSRTTLEIKDGIWHMRARELGHRETGLAIGRLLAEADYPAVRVFGRKSARLFVAFLYAATKRHFPSIRIPERYLEELRGYAEGSGLPYNVLFFMNFVFDILKKYGFHCSSVAFARPGEALVGRNTDLIPWIAKLTLKWFPPILLDVVVPGTMRYVHVTPGLFLGVLGGFNERGMAMMSHQIGATKEKPIDGNLATPLLQRMILEEASDMAQADSIIRANPIQRCISNLVTSSTEGTSRIYEITPESIRTTDATGPYLCCATHFKDHELSLLHRDKTTISQGRLTLMNQLAAKTLPEPDAVIAILKNVDNGIAHRKSGYSPTNEGTYQSIVFDVSGRRVIVSNGTRIPVSLTGEYREFVLPDD